MADNTVKPCINMSLDINIVNKEITVFNRETKKSYVLGEAEYNVLVQMDGTKTKEQLSQISEKYNAEQTESLIEAFRKMGFVQGSDVKAKKEFLKIKMGMVNGNRWIKMDSIITKLLYYIIVYLSVPLFFLGLYMFYIKTNGFQGVDISQILNMHVITHVLSFVIIATFHELAHAVVARKLKVAVPEIGIMLYLFVPYVYTNLSFIKLLRSKLQRILCLFAGILSNFLLAGISFFIAYCVNGNASLLFQEIAVMNVLIIVTNLMIFFKLDGYFILQELLDESYLREKSIGMVQERVLTVVKKFIAKKRNKTKVRYTIQVVQEENSFFYVLYGILSIGYVPILLVSAALNLIQRFI